MKFHLGCLPEGLKSCLDAVSLTTLIGSLVSALPAISSVLTVLWMGIRIYETETVQGLLKRKDVGNGL